jgi:hypothetical protein
MNGIKIIRCLYNDYFAKDETQKRFCPAPHENVYPTLRHFAKRTPMDSAG